MQAQLIQTQKDIVTTITVVYPEDLYWSVEVGNYLATSWLRIIVQLNWNLQLYSQPLMMANDMVKIYDKDDDTDYKDKNDID